MKIYRYRPLSGNTYEEIVNGEVWYSSLRQLNDPLEGFYINEAEDEALDLLIETLAVCCFSRIPDSLLMWAHYGDSHRGLCLEYEISEECLKTTFMHVEYSSQLPIVEAIRRYPADHPSAGCLQLDVHKEAKAFTTKSTEWDYEEELRTFKVRTNPGAAGELAKCPGVLTAILFGLRTPPSKIATFDKVLLDRPDVAFKRAHFRGDTYELELLPIDRSQIHPKVDGSAGA